MARAKATEIRPSLPLDDPRRRRLPPLLRRAWYGLNQAFRRRIAPRGLTPDQFTILRLLREGERRGMTQAELAQKMSSDPNTVSSLLARMSGSGLIRRKRDERDRRACRVVLSPAGRRAYRALRSAALALQGEILAALPAARRETFLAELEAVAEACRRASGEKGEGGERGQG